MKSYAKINTFLKIVGTRANYHEIASRFILTREIYDEISFEKASEFSLICMQNGRETRIENNIILKAMNALKSAGFAHEIDEFFSSRKILLQKNIPMGAGLGGGSSNAATFLKMANDELNLKISSERLREIGAKVGADVPFFVSGFEAANVSGIGEIIEPFEDEIPSFSVFTPNVFCSTPAVYGEFRANFMQNIDENLARKMLKTTSRELLENFGNSVLNDLYAPCLKIYPAMGKFGDKFLSGSGSSVFWVK